MSEQATVPEAPVSSATEAPTSAATPSKVSPAQDLRDIQMLLVSGIYPGNAAPAIVKAYQMLEMMAKQVETSSESK